jgi:hypothetical protein
MRERDMRQRVEQFMNKRLRAMLLPATLGVGLALGGCASDGLNSDDDGGARKDAAADTQPITIYGIVFPDAGPEAQPDYMAQMPDSGLPPMRYAAQMPDASGPINYPIYMALTPNT